MKIEKREPEFDEDILYPGEGEFLTPAYTLPLHEFRVLDYCHRIGLPCYLPLKQAWKYNNYTSKGKDYHYSKKVYRPMFPSYIFIRYTKEQAYSLFSTKSIQKLLPVKNQEAFLEEIRLIRKVELIGMEEELSFNSEIGEGDRFQIENGPWTGVIGWLEKKDGLYQWSVQIECINSFVHAQIDPSQYKMTRLEN